MGMSVVLFASFLAASFPCQGFLDTFFSPGLR